MRVVNIHDEKCDVYIGRKKAGMHFGNPFTHRSGTLAKTTVGSRAEAVQAYEDWLKGRKWEDVEPQRRKWILNNLSTLHGKLGCFCAPLACHGDVLVNIQHPNIYAGIGSRNTPPEILELMTQIAEKLDEKGYILRSGGAKGADSAFEKGSTLKDIFYASEATPEARELAQKFHPAWHRCNSYVRNLLGRNCFQVLGKDLDAPVKFVVCWTKDGRDSGGTGHTMRVAAHYGVTIYNLYYSEVREAMKRSLSIPHRIGG